MTEDVEKLSRPAIKLFDIKILPVEFSDVIERTAESKNLDESVIKYSIWSDINDNYRVYRDGDKFLKIKPSGDELRYTQVPDSKEPKAGMSLVFQMNDNKTGNRVAAKYVQEWNVDSVSEARIMSKFRHPNIASIYDLAISENGRIYMITEWVDGKSLSEWMSYPQSVEEIEEILSQIQEGVTYVNSKNVIHGDLKPENILITKNGAVKIIDFGISSPIDEGNLKGGTGLFSEDYAPPEQEGKYISTRTDVYSYAAIMFDMFTAQRGRKALESRNKFRENPDQKFPLSDLYKYYFDQEKLEKLTTVLHKALAINPNERYAKVEDMRVDLSKIFNWK